jgi:hypothetical protein
MRLLTNRARWVAVGGATTAALTLGCRNPQDSLLEADDPDIITPESANSPEGAEALRVGAMGRLQSITAGGENAWLLGGLLVDEWKSSDTFSQRNETDERKVQDNNGNVINMWRATHRARISARQAIVKLQEFKPNPAWGIGQMYFVMGFTEMTLAENWCNGIPLSDASTGEILYGPPLTTVELFTLALAHVDSALTFLSATDAATTDVRRATSITKARILINLARWNDAAALITPANVPTSYQLLATFSLTTTDNQIWSLNTSAKRWTVGDSLDKVGRIINAIPFASAKDPRVPVVGTSLGTSPAGAGFDTQTNFVYQTIWGRTDATPILSGLDARLMEAEIKLRADDIAGAFAILNALRATPPALSNSYTPAAMAARPTPATKDAAINLFFREKAFWTFARGQRLPDLRRLVRQYGRTQTSVFPQGTFFKTNVPYGTDVNFPVTTDELNNPDFKGCTDRNA